MWQHISKRESLENQQALLNVSGWTVIAHANQVDIILFGIYSSKIYQQLFTLGLVMIDERKSEYAAFVLFNFLLRVRRINGMFTVYVKVLLL